MPDPSPDATPEQIDSMLQSLASESEPAEPEPIAEPEQEAQADAPPDQAPEGDEPEPQAQETAPEAEAEEDISSKISEIVARLEESDLMRQKLEAKLDHERVLRDQSASKAGYYKKVAMDLAREAPARKQDVYADEDQEAPAHAQASPEMESFRAELATLRQDAVQRAISEQVVRFMSENPDANDLLEAMKPLVESGRAEYSEWLESGDPKLARQTTNLIMRSAYLDAKAKKIAVMRAEAKAKKASQIPAVTKAKQSAAISGSGSRPGAPAKAKTTKDMTAEQADALLKQLARQM